jgi:hypothetical protein
LAGAHEDHPRGFLIEPCDDAGRDGRLFSDKVDMATAIVGLSS